MKHILCVRLGMGGGLNRIEHRRKTVLVTHCGFWDRDRGGLDTAEQDKMTASRSNDKLGQPALRLSTFNHIRQWRRLTKRAN
jgi:hypothetical protein